MQSFVYFVSMIIKLRHHSKEIKLNQTIQEFYVLAMAVLI